MLFVEVFRFLRRRADQRPVRLAQIVDRQCHHESRYLEPSVTIIIPTRDKHELLRKCIESIQEKTTYENYQILVVNNDSKEPSALAYLKFLASTGVKVIDYPHKFNYSIISNIGVAETASEYVCFLNNDTEIVSANWLSNLLDHVVQPDVGLVGSTLLYSDGSIQHMGVALGLNGAAGHPFSGKNLAEISSEGLLQNCYEVSAVTFACALVSRADYSLIGGLDEKYKVGLNDVDFAIRLTRQDRKHVLCQRNQIIHHESQSRLRVGSPRGAFRAVLEILRFIKAHGSSLEKDYFFTR